MEKKNFRIHRQSTVDMAFEQMKAWILDGTWTPGQKIPSEMELSQGFGVNRLTVRNALQRLQALDLVDIRVGDGTYVRAFDLNAQLEKLSDFYVNERTIQDVVEYRLALELSCARMAAQRRTEEELDQFFQILQKFEVANRQYQQCSDPRKAEAYFHETVLLTSEMHRLLFGMTHNQLLEYAFTLARTSMIRHMTLNARSRIHDLDQEYGNLWVRRWHALYQALRDQDEETCVRITEEIIRLAPEPEAETKS